MRSDKFIGMACIVSIFGHKHDVIFKYVEINSSGEKSRRLPQPTTTNQRPIYMLKLATFSSTWSSWILLYDRIQQIQSKLTLVKNFFECCWRTFSLSRTGKVGNVSVASRSSSFVIMDFFLADADNCLMLTP